MLPRQLDGLGKGPTRILLVDDEESLLFAVGQFLRGRGHVVETVRSTTAANAILCATAFDLVIADLSFGAAAPLGGLEIVQTVRLRSRTTKILLLTAHASPRVESEARAKGADRVLTKPIPLALLDTIVAEEVSPSR